MKKDQDQFILALVFVLTTGAPLYAQAQKAVAPSKNKKTVSELLKQAGRGSDLKPQEKTKAALPVSKPLAPARAVSPVDLNKVKPLRTSAFMEDATDDKAKLEKITDQQIQELFKLTQRFKTSERRGELWLRLAELYVEKAGIIDFRKQSEYDAKLKEFHEGKTKIKPKVDLRDARDFNRKAIQLYEWFVNEFPKDDKMDQALFFLGYNHFELGDLKKGLYYYTRLTKDYPKSNFVTESHFALAEFYFENEQWKQSLENYLQVMKHRKHRLYGFSSYKASWCYFRSGSAHQALKLMERIIRENREDAQAVTEGKKSVSKTRLEKESLRDIVMFYAEAGDPNQAIEYFKNLAGQDANSYLEKLAYLYIDVGNRESGRTLFQHLIAAAPTNPKAFDYKFQIIQAYTNATKTREFREDLYSWIRDFAPGGAWYQANQANTALIENANKHRELTLKNWILTQHQNAQNSKEKFSQSLAYDGYQVYLKEFANSPTVADIHFYFAELLYDMEKFDEAGVHYRWVVENAPQSKYGSEAAKNIVITFEKNLPKDQEIARTVGKSIEPLPFSPKVEGFLNAAKWYLEKFPDTPKAPEIKFRAGRLYYQHNQFDMAESTFREIVKKYPKTKYEEYSVNLLLDIYSLKKDYVGLEKIGQELLTIPSVQQSSAGKDIKGVLGKAQFKKAQSLETEKKYQASAEEFEKFAEQKLANDLVIPAHFNAAINYERAGLNQKAIGQHLIVLAAKDKSTESLRSKSRRIIAKLYQDSGQLTEAAQQYSLAGKEAGKDPMASNFFNNAAVIFEASGDSRSALAHYEAYYDSSKKADAVEALFQMAQIHRKAGQRSRAIEKFKEYVSRAPAQEKAVEAAYWLHDSYRVQGKKSESDYWKRKTLALQKQISPSKSGAGAKWAAKIVYANVQESFQEFKRLRISNDPQKQKKSLDEKISALNRLTTELAEVIRYNSADEIIGSLFISGKANQLMAEAILNAALPRGLNAAEAKAYRQGIQKIADPFLSKANESFKSAYDRAHELEAYNSDYFAAREYLLKTNAALILDRSEIPVEFRQGSWVPL